MSVFSAYISNILTEMTNFFQSFQICLTEENSEQLKTSSKQFFQRSYSPWHTKLRYNCEHQLLTRRLYSFFCVRRSMLITLGLLLHI